MTKSSYRGAVKFLAPPGRKQATATEYMRFIYPIYNNNTSQQDFGTRKVYCVSNVTFHAESKYGINIFPSPTVFVQWPFKLLIFRNFWYFHQ